MICEFCKKEHIGSFQSGRFCNASCKSKYVSIKLLNNKKECSICKKIFVSGNLISHLKKHEREKLKLIKIYICEYCDKEKIGIYGSGRFCSEKCAKGFSAKRKRNERKKIKEKIINYCKCGNKIKSKSKLCRQCLYKSEEYRLKISNSNKGKTGGFRKNSGNGKQGWYKGYWCQSSYELAWVIYNLDHNIKFERNKNFFNYNYNGVEHKFYPDFKTNIDEFTEIKGFASNRWKNKVEQFPKNKKLIILYKNELKEIFKYVELTYGKNYIELYEGNPHKLKNNKCKICGKDSKREYCSRSCSGKAAFIRNHRQKELKLI